MSAFIAGLIQGITEFLPISSSGHLLIYNQLFGRLQDSLAFDAVLHLATGLALVVYFRKEWVKMLKNWKKEKLLLYIIIGSIPAGFAGLLFEGFIKSYFREVWVVIFMLVVVGAVMFYADKIWKSDSKLNEITTMQAFIIGMFQTLAFIPGTSRAGITILAGMAQGLSRKEAATLAFLLGTPITLAAGVFKLPDLVKTDANFGGIFIAFITAFVSGLVVINWLLKFLREKSLAPFAVYRIFLAFILVLIYYS